MYRAFFAAALFASLFLPASAQAPATSPTPSEPGSPVALEGMKSYTWYTAPAAGGSPTSYSCLSFRNVSNRTLASVTFEFSNRRMDGTATDVVTQKWDGPFAPGADVRSFSGEAGARPDLHALAHCAAFAPARHGANDAVRMVMRPIAATYDDGTQWHSAQPPMVITASATPSASDRGVPPPWDASHHAGYIAVLSRAIGPQGVDEVRIFAPGRRDATAVLPFPGCCAQSIAFDAAGDLLVGTAGRHTGLLVYAPGALQPTRTLADGDGIALANDPAGDLAIGGYVGGPDVAVYPVHGPAYHVPGRPTSRGLALSPAGELAVLDASTRIVSTYPAGATTPSRRIPLGAGPAAAGTNSSGSLAYDRDGRLAVADVQQGVVRVYEPAQTQPAFTVPIPGAINTAFDDAGRLYVLTRSTTTRYSRAGDAPETLLPIGGNNIAVGPGGRIVTVVDMPGGFVAVAGESGARFVIPVDGMPRSTAVSP